jgi:hypothetical protein
LRSGKFRLLAVAATKRFGLLPDTPTVAELGYPVVGGTYFAILGPATMPQGIVATLNREINRALAMPDARERLTQLGVEVIGGTRPSSSPTRSRRRSTRGRSWSGSEISSSTDGKLRLRFAYSASRSSLQCSRTAARASPQRIVTEGVRFSELSRHGLTHSV